MHESYVQMLLSFKNWGIAAYGTAIRLRVTAFSDVACSFVLWPQMAVKIKFLRLATDGSNRKNEFIKDYMFTFSLSTNVSNRSFSAVL